MDVDQEELKQELLSDLARYYLETHFVPAREDGWRSRFDLAQELGIGYEAARSWAEKMAENGKAEKTEYKRQNFYRLKKG